MEVDVLYSLILVVGVQPEGSKANTVCLEFVNSTSSSNPVQQPCNKWYLYDTYHVKCLLAPCQRGVD